MMRTGLWLAAVSLTFWTVCGCHSEGNAFSPTAEFVAKLQQQGEQLAKTELTRFNEIELASKDKVRYEPGNNPIVPGGAVYFKMYRDYTNAKLTEIHRSDSYLRPIVYDIVFDYRIMVTPLRHTDFPDSAEKVKGDTEYTLRREDSVTLSYSGDAQGRRSEAPVGLLPRDGMLNPYWNKRLPPGAPLVSPVVDPPAQAAGPQPPPPPGPPPSLPGEPLQSRLIQRPKPVR